MYTCIWLIPPGFMKLLLLFPCQELYSVLSFAGLLTHFSRDSQGLSKPLSDQAFPPTKPDQKRESTSENSSPYHLSCCLDTLLSWCHADSCRVSECAVGHQRRNWSSTRHSSPAPLSLKNNLAFWLGPWSPVTGHTLWLTCHSPPHGCCLPVQDNPLVSPGGGDFLPVLQLSPSKTAKMHRATNEEPPTLSCSTAAFSILNIISGFFTKIFHFDKYFVFCISISLESAVLHERAEYENQLHFWMHCTLLISPVSFLPLYSTPF